MEERKGRIILNKAGGNASKSALGAKISLPKKWVDEMGITPEDRDIILIYDNKEIVIRRVN